MIVAGDGRCDLPGKCAKFCTYSMDVSAGKILHDETVEVGLQTPNMEREALIRSLNFLVPQVKCTEIITDASTSIRNKLGCYKLLTCIL